MPGADSWAEALRLLARRSLTEQELRRRLRQRGHPEADVNDAITRCRAAGYVDDLALARAHMEARARRGGHGRRRLLLDLERRGVSPEIARRAWDGLVDSGGVDPDALLRREAARRVAAAGEPLDRRRAARVYNALLRAGFESEPVRRVLGRHLHGLHDGNDDDLA